eukprot:CAMPEP_0173400274 /NCGR_PEP_ID=MMETSP1356-20130122/47463_1 /TAXON_ID=77927 ORGANISM="Hemiselmis virescens, Strain PCC157" /NCGR_SAMPLE_ID=MMETSP1356 /ASSEMBLY_ACC=CAM_ASM_000847 /LENGTH=265 /DNA_ID=CAMNT_0014360169 /DNA_START=42 /DNA_END=836 /DNA_ORIENTATION=-
MSTVVHQIFARHGHYIPLAAVAAGTLTLLTTLKLAYDKGHVPAGMWLPFISLCGASSPERWVYMVGFCTTAVCIFASATYAKAFLLPILEPEHQRLALRGYYAAMVAGLGLVGQAVIPLQSNILDVINRKASVTSQSMIHQSSAALLFLAGYFHCVSMDLVLWRSRTVPSPLWSKRVKIALTVTMLGPFFLAFIPHPATGAGASIDAMSWGAVGQWCCVVSLLLFFGSYHIEFARTPQALSAARCGGSRTHSEPTEMKGRRSEDS